MPGGAENSSPPADDRYHGFSLRSVCWGYRQVFADAIEALLAEGLIGPHRREVTGAFFDLLKQADQSCFDHVLKEFLGALNPATRWLLDVPGLFADVVDLGRRLAEARLHYGVRYFETLGQGGFGSSPRQVRDLLTHLRGLRQVDDELAVALLKGYRRLAERMRPHEIERYCRAGLEIFRRSRSNGLAFLAGTLSTSEHYIRAITQEACLADEQPMLEGLLRALAGRAVEVHSLQELDSDELLDRGSGVVCAHRWLYLPARLRRFDDARMNRKWYLLTCIAAAGALAQDSFCAVHGHPRHATCRTIAGDGAVRLNLFQVLEYVRVLRGIVGRWPGARRLIDFALRTEFASPPPAGSAEQLLRDAMAGRGRGPAVDAVRREADESVNLFDTARRLDGAWVDEVVARYPGVARRALRPLSFLPDFCFPLTIGDPPPDSLVADLRREARRARRNDDASADDRPATDVTSQGDAAPPDQAEAQPTAAACYLYDEWSQPENNYYRQHCSVYEAVAAVAGPATVPPDVAAAAAGVRKVFELLKPDLSRRAKRLRDGDAINCDHLVDYLVRRRAEPAPTVDFYEKPRTNQRDLAVIILLDASGSTGEPAGAEGQHPRVIDLEKQAALILSCGLASLGDRFAVCGFGSSGREKCTYFIYKDFDDPWGAPAAGRVLSARPFDSTRIGPALRHSGWRLAGTGARRRLIIVVTDGKPMDTGYDPNSRYAQHDVRMACQENGRQGVHTFGISTAANTLADMEIMFPRRRFAILSDIRQLPRVLPRLYVRLTV